VYFGNPPGYPPGSHFALPSAAFAATL
jgi:hypothetical protein